MISTVWLRLLVSTVFLVAELFCSACGLAQARRARLPTIEQLFQTAQDAEHLEDFRAAAQAYREIVRLDPAIPEVWSNLGMALFHLHADADAIAAFQRASLLKPSLLAPHLFQGLAYLEDGAPQKAIPALKQALALSPGQAEAMLGLSDAYAQTRQFAPAARTLHAFLEQHPDSEEAGSRLASTYFEWAMLPGSSLRQSPTLYGRLLNDEAFTVEHPEGAEAALRATVHEFPGSVEARLALSRFLIDVQPTPEHLSAALLEVNAAAQLAPTDLEVAALKLRLAIARHDENEAIATTKEIAYADPAYLLANAGAILKGLPEDTIRDLLQQARAAKPGGAGYTLRLKDLDQARTTRPLTPSERVGYTSAAWHLHRFDEALAVLAGTPQPTAAEQYWLYRTCEALVGEVLVRTLASHPESKRSHLLLANLAMQHDDFDTGRSHYQAALAIDPHDPQAKLLYIRALVTARDTTFATQEAQNAAAEFPQHAELNFLAGELTLVSGGEPAVAAGFLERSVRSDPKLTAATVDLADAYARLQRVDDAIRVLSQVVATDQDGSLHYRLARWYQQTGHPREAAEAMAVTQHMKDAKLGREVKVFERGTTRPR